MLHIQTPQSAVQSSSAHGDTCGGAGHPSQPAPPSFLKKKNDLPIETLRQLLACDFLTGKFTWRVRPADMFQSQANCNAWNTKHANKPTFISKSSSGYFMAMIFDTKQYAHRVIWALHSDEWPKNQIDHINGNRGDNRIANLRAATPSENQHNRRISANNTVGLKGVHFHIHKKKWGARILINGHNKYLGYFTTPESAHAAYCEAAAKFFGEFANSGVCK